MADGFVQGAEAQGGQLAAHVPGQQAQETFHMFGAALEAGTQLFVLSGDARRQRPFMQLRHMTQPMLTISAVPKANSSAPSRAATSTSRPVRSRPSVWRDTRRRMPQVTSA